MRLKEVILLPLVCAPLILSAQDFGDVPSETIDSSLIVGHPNTSLLKQNMSNGVAFDVNALEKYPHLFGQTDPVRFVQSLPGVQTSSVFEPGLNVLGSQNSQNEFSLAGAPFYPSPRFLGLFPMINTDAFSEIRFRSTSDGNYLGGYLSWDLPDTLSRKTRLNASLGLVSAQATVVVPAGEKLEITASARKSYLNLLFSSLLKFDGNTVGYDFADANASVKWHPNAKNSLDATLYYSRDVGNAEYVGSVVGGVWDQKLASVRWRHNGSFRQEHVFFATDANKTFQVESPSSNSRIEMYRKELGWKSTMILPLDINLHPSIVYYGILPQYGTMSSNYKDTQAAQPSQTALLGSVGADRVFKLGDFSLTPGVVLTYYDELGFPNRYFHFDPSLKVEYDFFSKGVLSLDLGRKHQYFTEFSALPSMVPIQFWVADGHYVDPQESIYAVLTHTVDFGGGMWSVKTQLYGKKLWNQAEYNGFYLSMVFSNYRLEDYILKTEGYNFGADIMISKNSGALTGWISYSYGKALRQTDAAGYPDVFPASYERPHEFNAVASYKLGRFDLGGTVVFASGTPYTPIREVYFISDMLLSQYDNYNSGRLKPYFRIDLSATWNLKSRGNFSHGLNLSVYNATASKNETGYCMMMDKKTGEFYYGPTQWVARVIPSISYFIKL